MWPFSHTATDTPCFARNHAVETPTMPPPMMTTSAAGGMAVGTRKSRVQVRETVSLGTESLAA